MIQNAKAQLTDSRIELLGTDPRNPDLVQFAENIAANYDHLANLIEQLNSLTP